MNPLAWTENLIQEFAPSVAANPWGFGTEMEVLKGCEAWEYHHAGQRALLAVRPVTRSAGTRLDVIALVSTGDRLDGATFDNAVTQLGHQYRARQLAMSTLRPHVAAVCRRTGWEETGILMIKKIGLAQ